MSFESYMYVSWVLYSKKEMKKWDIRNNSVGSKKEDQSLAAWLLRSSCAAKKVA